MNVLTLLAMVPLHTPGISQGRVLVDDNSDGVVVSAELVFARADAARLPPSPFSVVLLDVDGVVRGQCPAKPAEVDDVEGDGRAWRFEATCPPDDDLDGDDLTIAWQEALDSLGPSHRLLLRLPGDALAGADPVEGATMRKMGDAPLPLRTPKPPSTNPVAIAGWLVGCLAVGLGSRHRKAAALNLGLAAGGTLLALLITAFGAPMLSPLLLGRLAGASAGAAVVSLVVAPRPQLRPVALVLGALAIWWLRA